MSVAVIPARGGSKRIPRKNIRSFCGLPMIGWSIRAAIGAGCFERIVVSTDDPEIAEVARGLGAEVPFLRPAALSDDFATTIDVMQHAVGALGADGCVCCLYATAPFVRADDLARGAAALVAGDWDYAFPVTSFGFPIQRALRREADGRIAMFDPAQERVRSQDLTEAFHDVGQFYWGRADAWRGGRSVYGPRSTTILLPRHRVQDIDTPEDWARAEVMFRVLAEEGRQVDGG
ncbi:pseudaminic acid cytidylyltransferase [Paragemmobacter straminiformis]|uniref:Pseudaminic acid cytidylyltransferase n=1 Tax=Paragemmobacter straminiformis TaxID=2045119 RepID=A0A842I8Y4_9RHOB|nr:pseudaminic acid cytidylyltransferase [Gemmobacter straminiformis]MBC2836300.1 pseudaminic acid cytidylyltransferase [Gemmobacter straminiformis]